MSFFRIECLCLSCAAICLGQMTPEQKASDFYDLAAVYAINYGPVQWKRDALGVDVLKIGSWLQKVAATADDLDFYEVCVAYVAALDDAHDLFLLPSDFEASMGFTTDIYDGKVLVDTMDRTRLPEGAYPFQVGDEVVSIDGIPVLDLMASFRTYAIAGNPLSSARVAADFLTYRSQAVMPHAHLIGDSAVVQIQHQSGAPETFTIPWTKTGMPISMVGPVISPSNSSISAYADTPGSTGPLARMRNMRIAGKRFLRGFGETAPVFDLPANFRTRLGPHPFDFFYSGTFPSQGLLIGYLRIPSFDGGSFDSTDFQNEISFMQKNTDGLILDITRNPGGDGCFAEDLLARVNPNSFRSVGLEIRATRSWVSDFLFALEDAMARGADYATIQQLQKNLLAVEQAFGQPSGRTPPLPVCGPSLDLDPAQNAYTKPILLLTDEFTASAADLFAAVMQDNQRAILFGQRTMGAGGNVNEYQTTLYSEGAGTVTESLMSRPNQVTADGFPATRYIENIGVHPDIVYNYMTVDNLLSKGRTFVNAFTDAMVTYINSKR